MEQASWTLEARKLFLQKSGFLPKSKILEAGCGTGAILSSIQILQETQLYGIDIKPDMVQFADKINPQSILTCADAFRMPFPDEFFDAVICHFLLLWVLNPESLLNEFSRVLRPGGIIGLLAEPDYGSRIDYPPVLEKSGSLQREALFREGANPDIGRQIGELLGKSGCLNISTGILGSFQSESNIFDTTSEQSLLKSDLKNFVDSEELERLVDLDFTARNNHSRVQFVPTFFGWGNKPF